jgi:biofilm PGA synthesis N-glycosyltransferase PgaC
MMKATTVTVLIPAYNEARTIAGTLESVFAQTRAPDVVLVVDDGSTDNTGAIAAGLGARVIRPAARTGFKAGALNAGLAHVDSEWVVTLDADTILAPDAVQEIVAMARESRAAAACGQVLPQRIHSVWERARLVEYLFAFGMLKPVQDFYGHPLVASGCFSLYHVDTLRRLGGFPVGTVGEDLDLTWRLFMDGQTVKYAPRAICYTVEPPSLSCLRRQLCRWSHGFVQNVRLHGRRLFDVPMLRSFILVAFLDALFAGLLYGLLAPILLWAYGPQLLLTFYAADLLFIIGPVAWAGYRRGLLRQALVSLPFVFVLRLLNTYYFWRAIVMEGLFRRPLQVFEKGH